MGAHRCRDRRIRFCHWALRHCHPAIDANSRSRVTDGGTFSLVWHDRNYCRSVIDARRPGALPPHTRPIRIRKVRAGWFCCRFHRYSRGVVRFGPGRLPSLRRTAAVNPAGRPSLRSEHGHLWREGAMAPSPYAILTKSAAHLSPVKRVLVTANESPAILFLVTILVAVAFLITVVGVLVCFMLFCMKVFVPIHILSSSLETISIACVYGDVSVSPSGVRIGALVPSGQPIRIVAVIQSINVRAYLPAVVAVVVSGLISVAISLLEVIVLTHIFLVAFVSTFVVSGVEIMLFTAACIIAALT